MPIAAAIAMIASGLLFSNASQAVHDDGVFELEGNAVDDAAAGDDWANVFNGTDSATLATFKSEADGKSIFTGGGSKDDLDIPGWRHKDGSVPDKDDMQNGFAARYGDNLYFGADRTANNGDAQIGIWFFQQEVAPQPDGTFGPGTHEEGDILVLSDFTQGGTQPTIRVFEWQPGGEVNGTLHLLAGTTLNVATCGIQANDNYCAIVNSSAQASPWPFAPKNSPANVFQAGELYEGGIDLEFLGLQDECFSSVLLETRSSQSVDAVLKDFIGGSFESCNATLSTTPSPGAGGTVTPGTIVTDTATVTGGGVSNPPTPTGDVTFFLCGPIATGLCTSGGTDLGASTLSGGSGTATATSANVDTTNLTPGRYCFRAEWPGDSNYVGALTHTGVGDSECFIVAKIPTSTVTTPVDGSGTALTTSVPLGTTVHDRAVVTGTAAGGAPTGSVSFSVCGPIASPNTCDAGGTSLGSAALAAVDATSSSATSAGFTATTPGRYCFRAEYGGSLVYLGSSDSSITECFVVAKLPTGTVTTPVDGSGTPVTSVTFGTTVYDEAVVTGSAAGGAPTGSVSFSVCGPIASPNTCDAGGTSLGSAVLVAVDATSSSATSAGFTATTPGRYCFRAEYGGDTNYTGSSDSSITECFVVTDTTTLTTAQQWTPNDSATITAAGGSSLNGSVAFGLYETDDCTGTALYTETIPLAAAPSGTTVSTTNTSVHVTSSTTVYWSAVFTSSDSTSGSGGCVEQSILTIDDDNTD